MKKAVDDFGMIGEQYFILFGNPNIQWYLVSTLVTAEDLFRPLSSPPCFEGTEEAHSARGRSLKMIEDERAGDVDD